ncbi:fructoselysine-6-P-deglycase FrlB-like protein [Streptosporangium becharense]|uniref:Fructoselysine-6-P-deglycase FrlB-like protein n=1 Tax=Streptosporangium becharense TaxID=1816182 RepID=A0A7W9IK85_9ACTN|nr:sugar isomerase [Streptosporangium becharense]MBB2911353.1 fructoselysine-6-P-deglycase FrlB-like protein [Streptosporangium becharense]MBB5821589.1 fructoselysine-6-P-deglycase FrlB-like protein [Streptosporangium becharense]
MTFVANEIASQPSCWERAIELSGSAPGLPEPGERVAVVGCGTSLFIAQSYAALRESAGLGETDAFAASEFPHGRAYDKVVAICRSGTTTEVLELLRATSLPTVAVIGDPATPIVELADVRIVLDFADEKSVVQTRFATTALTLLRAHLARSVPSLLPADLSAQAAAAVDAPLPPGAVGRTQFTFLGGGWTNGIAHEAALKLREASGSWTESYPAMEYRHGPISVTDSDSVVWFFGPAPDGLVAEVERTGAIVSVSALDPVADLIRAQRLAVALAEAKGVNPDEPRNLTRSVILA